MHNQIWVWSLKKYAPQLLVNNTGSNYHIFATVNIAYIDHAEKKLKRGQ